MQGIDITARKRIVRYLEERVLSSADPRKLGSPLRGLKAGLWRYRVGNYRIVYEIDDATEIITVATVGHRRDVYRRL